MKVIQLLLFAILLTLISCGEGKIDSGEIEYEITYPYNKIDSKMMQMMLPKKMTVIFKGGKILARIQKGSMFTTEVISDEDTKNLEMRLNFGSDIFNTNLKKEDLKDLFQSQPKYDQTGAVVIDTLLGCNTNTYMLECKNDTFSAFTSVFSEDFNLTNAIWFSSYKNFKGMPLVYLINRYGIIMKITATKITKREVIDTEFDPTEKYKEISYKKYDKKLSGLFSMIQ